MNYTGASSSGVSISGNSISMKTDNTAIVTGDSGISRKEEFVFDENNVNSNGFEVVNAASGKKVDRQLKVKITGDQVQINESTKKLRGTIKGSGNIQVNGNSIVQAGYGAENGLATENGKMVYKQIYNEGDGIKFTAASDTEVYSKTSIGVNYDDTMFGVSESGALYRKDGYTAEEPINIDSDGKVSLAVDDVTMKNVNNKL